VTRTKKGQLNNTEIGRVIAVLAVLMLLLAAIPALGQNRNAGEIRGSVLDSSGGAVPGVTVSVKNVATGVVTTATTGEAGVYDIPWVETGRYNVTFTKEGFQQVVRNDVELHVETITVDATMKVGSVATTITVTSSRDLLQTESTEKSLILTTNSITELPNVGHNYGSYMLLVPGANPGQGSSGDYSNGGNIGINGSQANDANWLLDGGTFTYPGSYNGTTAVPMEAISEVNINASNMGAEYGNGLFSFSVITKSGTNQFHGSAFEFVQNNVFNARNFFSPSVAPERWNEYGGTIGGPIKKDKAFFFFSYQRNPTVGYSPSFYTYPTQAMRQGNFSGGAFPTLYDPSTTTQVDGQYMRTAFNGNIISPIDKVGAAIDSYFPTPQTSALYNNYFVNDKDPATTDWYNFKVDVNISAKQRIMFSGMLTSSFTVQNSPANPIGTLDIWGPLAPTLQLTDTYTISPTLINEFRIAFNRGAVYNWGPDFKQGYPAKLGLNNAVVDAFPNISVSGAVSPSGLGTAPSNGLWQNNFGLTDTFDWIKGKHAIKMGGEYDKWQVNQDPFDFVDSGNFSFNGIFTSGPNPTNPTSVGLGYADLLLGLPNSWNVLSGPETGGRVWNAQLFIQDSYKVRPNLTLNVGLRYLNQQGWTEEHDHIAQFDPTLTNAATGTLGAVWYGGEDGRRGVQASHHDIFTPRIGVAWSPRTTWTVRAGYGLYTFPWGDQNYFGSGQGEDGWFIQGTQTTTDNVTPIFTMTAGPPLPVYPPSNPHTALNSLLNGQNLLYNPYHVPMTYMQQWHFGFQHQMGGYLIDVAYVGSVFDNLGFGADINQVPESKLAPGNAQLNRPYPQFSTISGVTFNGRSGYNALQMAVRKRMSHGFSMLMNYTYSHSLDTGTGQGGNGMLRTDIWQNAYNPSANYGNSVTDIRHNFNGSIVYELPFGKGHQFVNNNSVADAVIGGWQASTIILVHSGLPFTPVVGTANFSGAITGTWFPNRMGSGKLSNPTIQQWFNPAAFTAPTNYTFGNSGRNILYGPNLGLVNFSLAKTFNIEEKVKLQIRADATDLFNSPNFGQPNTGIGTSGAGIISSADDSRTIQLGAVLRF
jgi:outer membrane receptor protein involved in Fe transport